MKIALGSDHAGFALKEAVKKHLLEEGYEVLDEGTFNEDRCDYPDFAVKAAEDVVAGKASFGVLCCGTGEGISIAANKVRGIRCGIGYDLEVTRLCRQHNDANMIAFGARFMKEEDVLKRVDAFLTTSFEGGRHAERVAKITNLDRHE